MMDLYWTGEYGGPDPNEDIFAGVVFYADKNHYSDDSLLSWKLPEETGDTDSVVSILLLIRNLS